MSTIKQLTAAIVLGVLLVAPAVALPLSARIGQDLTQALREPVTAKPRP